ncbi:prephenate dehydrogenase/arogenate dehydrogenase family protein [Streptomyces sp. NPDC048438]|uniref:prephenate dehydrogenase/arogenate dehydrogenase family protein n=1 Tax=Streptomyces sp. NPDC048438 TaxID=3365551 RepID=UPI0037223497
MMPRTVAVVGSGVIASSVAAALGRHGVDVLLLPEDPARADAGGPRVPVDLAVLDVHPSGVGPALAAWQRRGLAYAYTDVAGIKSVPERDVAHGPADAATYVGGHPVTALAGRDASAALFEGRPWVLTPTPVTSQETLNRALALTALCGAVPVVMKSAAHDHAMAQAAHAPYAMAALLAARFHPAVPEVLRLTGPELRDATRTTAAGPEGWSDVLRGNASAVAEVLREVSTDLTVLLDALDGLSAPETETGEESMKHLRHLLERAHDGQAALSASDSSRAGGPR